MTGIYIGTRNKSCIHVVVARNIENIPSLVVVIFNYTHASSLGKS